MSTVSPGVGKPPLAPRPINTLNERSLHADLKQWYAQPGDRLEQAVGGFLIDIVRGELLIEIQTGSFAAIRRKLRRLIEAHPVRLVYPIAQEKWIVKLARDGRGPATRRKSPRRGTFADLFAQLVHLPELPGHPNFTLDALLIHEMEVRQYDPQRAWRRGHWVTRERRLLRVVESRLFRAPAELAALAPATLPERFTTAELAATLGRPRRLAQQMAYCLRRAGAIAVAGKQGRSMLYTAVH